MHAYLKSQATRLVDDDFPPIVECRFKDVAGCEWVVIEKWPVVTSAEIPSAWTFPYPVLIACEIISQMRDDFGRERIRISTERPWGIEATDGTTTFSVFADQIDEASP